MSSSTDSPSKGNDKSKRDSRKSFGFMRRPSSMKQRIRSWSASSAGDVHEGEDEDPGFSLDLLNESQMLRLKRAFSIFDKDDSGSISSDEMLQVCAPRPSARGGARRIFQSQALPEPGLH